MIPDVALSSGWVFKRGSTLEESKFDPKNDLIDMRPCSFCGNSERLSVCVEVYESFTEVCGHCLNCNAKGPIFVKDYGEVMDHRRNVELEALNTAIASWNNGTKTEQSQVAAADTFFNINRNVFVKLTELGHHILEKKGISFNEEDDEGWSKWQLWVLMQTFGDYMATGSRVPFETTIRLGAVD